MVDTTKLAATVRTEFGKGAARRARRAGLVPAVLYGHGTEPVHLSLPGHETMLAVRQANVLLEVEFDGKSELCLPKQVTKDPLGNVIEHVDLLLVKRGEKVTVEVPLVPVGEHGHDTMMMQDLQTLAIEADATKLPEQIEVDITGVTAPHQILAGDITLPEGASLIDDPEVLALNFVVPTAEAPAAAEESAEGDAE